MTPKYAGVIVTAADTGRVLLLHRSQRHRRSWSWELPGGHIEPGEEPIDAACRELREETGYDARRRRWRRARTSANGYVLHFSESPKEFSARLSDEHDAFAWVEPCAVPHGIHPALRELLSC